MLHVTNKTNNANNALIYVYRNWLHKIPAYKDMAIPIIPSIASFRSHDKTTTIYVIDASENENEWLDLPAKLSFNVIRQRHAFRHVAKIADDLTDKRTLWSLLSKPLDVYSLVQTLDHKTYVVSDADVLFVKPFFPLLEDPTSNFVCGLNTGMFYFDKRNPLTERVFEVWSSLCALSILHHEMRDKLNTHKSEKYPNGMLQEESVYRYMLKHYQDILKLKHIPIYENFTPDLKGDRTKIKAFHLLGKSTSNRNMRGMAGIYIKEIRQNIERTLTKEDMQQVFGNIDTDTYSITEEDLMEKVNKAIK